MRRLWLCLFIFGFGAASAQASCRPDVVDVRGADGSARFTVDVADDNAERARGLMFVESMPRFKGMIFFFERPVEATFWMRNTLIPLDMLFVRPDGTVQHVHENAEPLSEETVSGGTGILAVLEINGGMSEMLGLGEGSELRHPGFDQSIAAWPCEPSVTPDPSK